MKALVGAFNQEKALGGAFSVIVQSVVEPMEHYTALVQASPPVTWSTSKMMVTVMVTMVAARCTQYTSATGTAPATGTSSTPLSASSKLSRNNHEEVNTVSREIMMGEGNKQPPLC